MLDPMEYINTVRRHLLQRRRFAASRIAFGARIQGDSTLGDGTSVGTDALILDSRVGANSAVGRHSMVRKSVVGDHTRIGAESRVTDSNVGGYAMLGNKITLHKSEVGNFSYFSGNSSICTTKIGKFCSIAYGLLSGLGEHPTNYMTTSRSFYSNLSHTGDLLVNHVTFDESKPVIIGNDVWLGCRVFIRNGVKIGDGAIIGAGSVVIRDVEPYSISVGIPARHMRFRFTQTVISELLGLRWWDWETERLKNAAPFLAQTNTDIFLEWAKRSA